MSIGDLIKCEVCNRLYTWGLYHDCNPVMTYNDRPVKCPYCEQIFNGVAGHLCNSVYHLNPCIHKETLPSEEDPDITDKNLEDALLKHCKPKKQTLVVNIIAGPGARKSTMCAGIFFDLKSKGINCEIATEHAKDLIYNKDLDSIHDQIYLFGNQFHRIKRLLGEVDVILTDSPLVLQPVYDKEKRETFEQLVMEEMTKMWNYNVFLKRSGEHDPNGRIHNKEQSIEIDKKILDLLDKYNEGYETFEGTEDGKNKIVGKILSLLKYNKIIK